MAPFLALLAALGDNLGALGALLGRSWTLLGRLLGRTWALLKAIWASEGLARHFGTSFWSSRARFSSFYCSFPMRRASHGSHNFSARRYVRSTWNPPPGRRLRRACQTIVKHLYRHLTLHANCMQLLEDFQSSTGACFSGFSIFAHLSSENLDFQ